MYILFYQAECHSSSAYQDWLNVWSRGAATFVCLPQGVQLWIVYGKKLHKSWGTKHVTQNNVIIRAAGLCCGSPLPRTKLSRWVNDHERDQHCAYFGSRAGCLMLISFNWTRGFWRKRPFLVFLLSFPSYNQISCFFSLLMTPGMVWYQSKTVDTYPWPKR